MGGLGRKAVVDCLADEGVDHYMMTEAFGKGAVDEMTAPLKGLHMRQRKPKPMGAVDKTVDKLVDRNGYGIQ